MSRKYDPLRLVSQLESIAILAFIYGLDSINSESHDYMQQIFDAHEKGDQSLLRSACKLSRRFVFDACIFLLARVSSDMRDLRLSGKPIDACLRYSKWLLETL